MIDSGRPSSRPAARRGPLALAATFVLAACATGPGFDDAWTTEIDADGSTIALVLTGGDSLSAGELAEVRRWIGRSVEAVVAYYGRFPVPRVQLVVRSSVGSGIGSGVTHGGDVPTIQIAAGRATDRSAFDGDWILTHEMVHLALPELDRRHHWLEEGLATYIEPVARCRVGQTGPEDLWADLVHGLEHGRPRPGDGGLDDGRRWGRTYWGGALFCLVADVEIHRRTEGRLGLQDALRGVLDDGGSIRESWTIERTLAAADRAIGGTVLGELYQSMGVGPGDVDLADLWRSLGVVAGGGHLRLSDDVELASIRRAIEGRSE